MGSSTFLPTRGNNQKIGGQCHSAGTVRQQVTTGASRRGGYSNSGGKRFTDAGERPELHTFHV